ncbi:MAG: hypothetical protein M1835_000525 [Candelina submexicana]|nr:MAG: hypothetical protein M1835_000525 [Candelina submexicana]
MAENVPRDCCVTGVKHEGTAQGQMKKIGETETYLSYPKDGNTQRAVLLLTDVIGHRFINAQLIADQLAANGYFVVMPDLFHGDSVPLNRPDEYDMMKWFHGPPGHSPDQVVPIVDSILKEMRGPMGCKKIGGVGYCFGGNHVVLQLKEGKLDAGFIAHPSHVGGDAFRGITKPLSIAAAETDGLFGAKQRHGVEEILAEVGQPYQINLYSGVKHGFAVRADLNVKQNKFAKEQAFIQAVSWLNEWM